jgi:hypothetical protein
MARNGHAITTKAVNEPADLYDTLTQSDQDVFDRIGTLGYIPEQGNSGLWLAKKRADPKRIAVGPANNLKDLLSRIQDEIAEEKEFDNDVDSGEMDDSESVDLVDYSNAEPTADSPAGDGYLFPGMKPTQQKAVPALATAILNYESYKRERMDALAKEVEAKTEVVGLMRANKDALAFDPKTGIRSYRVNDYIEELVPGEEKLKSRRVSDEDED